MLEQWIDDLAAELGIEADVDADLILDVARVAAHEVERRAAPVTTFMIGIAASRAGGDSDAVVAAANKASALASGWTASR